MLRDIWLVCGRELAQRFRQPVWLVMGLAQPLLFMFFFGPLLSRYVRYTPGFPPGGTWMIFAPALVMMMVLTGSTSAGFALLAEHGSGVLDRLRVVPISPVALLLGKVAAVSANVLAQSILIVMACRVVFGANPSVAGLFVALLIAVLLSATIACCSYGLALRIKNQEALVVTLNAALLPLMLLSGTYLPITTELAPPWLYRLSRVDPIAQVMDATRASFRGDFSIGALFPGVAVLLAIAAASLWFGLRTFVREGR